jgi:hypothetical protein
MEAATMAGFANAAGVLVPITKEDYVALSLRAPKDNAGFIQVNNVYLHKETISASVQDD